MLLAAVQSRPDGESPTDAALMERILQRDPSALEILYDRYGRPVYSLVLRIAQQPASAEELVQDVFLQLWRKADRFQESRGPLAPWLFTIARNRALDFLRREKQGYSGASTRYQVLFDEYSPADTLANSVRSDPEGDLDRSRQAVRVRNLMASFPDGQRRALELAYFEGMSHSEIAAAMGEALGTVKSWIRSGLARLRESLGEERK